MVGFRETHKLTNVIRMTIVERWFTLWSYSVAVERGRKNTNKVGTKKKKKKKKEKELLRSSIFQDPFSELNPSHRFLTNPTFKKYKILFLVLFFACLLACLRACFLSVSLLLALLACLLSFFFLFLPSYCDTFDTQMDIKHWRSRASKLNTQWHPWTENAINKKWLLQDASSRLATWNRPATKTPSRVKKQKRAGKQSGA
jgi:hypothetical protein